MHTYKNLMAFTALFSIAIAAPNIFDEFTEKKDNPDNPLITCFTNPCVQVDGVGKIMGSTKVRTFFTSNLHSKFILKDHSKDC